MLLIPILFLLGCKASGCDSDAANYDGSLIVQSVLDDQPIQKFLHIKTDPSERLPLVVTGDVLGGLSRYCVRKGGERVTFASIDDVRDKKYRSYIVFTKFNVEADSADVEFDYPVEGLSASMTLKKVDGKWGVASRELSLH